MRPVPVHLITGLTGAGKSSLLRGWLSARPEGERWAVLVDGLPDSLGVGTDIASSTASSTALPGAASDAAGVTVVGLMGGCACCVGGPAFGVAVNSLLRQGPWDRLFIEVSAAANGAALVDRLRSEPLASRLQVQPVILVVNQETARPYLDETRSGYQHAQDRLALARCVVLNRASDSLASAPLVARLSEAPPWPRALIKTADGTVPWNAIRAAHDAVPAGPKGACILQWAPEVCFDRRRLRALLDAAVASGGVWQMAGLRQAHAVFRTERAWYAWRWDGRAIDWRESDWRLESRLLVLADRSPDPHNEHMRLASAIAVAAGES